MQIISTFVLTIPSEALVLVIVTDPRFNLAQLFQHSVLQAIKLRVYELHYEILSYNNNVKASDSLSVHTTISKPFMSLTSTFPVVCSCPNSDWNLLYESLLSWSACRHMMISPSNILILTVQDELFQQLCKSFSNTVKSNKASIPPPQKFYFMEM